MSATPVDLSQDPAARILLTDPLPHIIPFGGISLLAGAPNVGKTALLARILKALHEGKPVFGHTPPAPVPVGVIAVDRSWARGAGAWFERVGFGDVAYYSMIDDPKFDPRTLRRKFDRTRVLLEMIDKLQLPRGGLVSPDPLALFLGGNLNDYDTCAVACLELRTGLRDRGLSMLATAHAAKIKADKNDRYLRLQDQLLGSTAIAGFADTQAYLAAPEEIKKPYYAFLWHPHTSRPETFKLERDEQGLFVEYSGADEGNCTRVLAFFPEDGAEVLSAAIVELAEAIPLSRATTFRVLETLVERERVVKVKHGVYSRVVLH